MNGISGYTGAPMDPALEYKTRIAPKLKPEIERVLGNPFYPDGRTQVRSADFPRQVFEANLPTSQQEVAQKLGTMLNTLA
ncbi:MAG: hypothetical protein ABQ298_09830 [Puniceicoccaceae bacterium]